MKVVLDMLDQAKVSYQVHEHPEVATIEEARALVPHLTIDLLKTVVFEVKDTERLLLVAVPCLAQVDYKSVAQIAGCSRRALRLVNGERIESELGFQVGGVRPFAIREGCEVVLDGGIDSNQLVKVGGGPRTLTIELAFSDLQNLSAATVARVSKQ